MNSFVPGILDCMHVESEIGHLYWEMRSVGGNRTSTGLSLSDPAVHTAAGAEIELDSATESAPISSWMKGGQHCQ